MVLVIGLDTDVYLYKVHMYCEFLYLFKWFMMILADRDLFGDWFFSRIVIYLETMIFESITSVVTVYKSDKCLYWNIRFFNFNISIVSCVDWYYARVAFILELIYQYTCCSDLHSLFISVTSDWINILSSIFFFFNFIC